MGFRNYVASGVAALRLSTISHFPGGLRRRLTSSRRVAASLTGYSSCLFHQEFVSGCDRVSLSSAAKAVLLKRSYGTTEVVP